MFEAISIHCVKGFLKFRALRCCHRHSRKEPPLGDFTSDPVCPKNESKQPKSNESSLLLEPLDHGILGRILHKFHHNRHNRPVSFTLKLEDLNSPQNDATKALPKKRLILLIRCQSFNSGVHQEGPKNKVHEKHCVHHVPQG